MKPRKATYLVHRWLGALIALQLLAWSIGGFVFSILDIEDVRGTTDARAIQHEPIDQTHFAAFPDQLHRSIERLNHDNIASVMLTDRGLGAFWEVRDSESGLLGRFDPQGNPAGIISAEDATMLALRDFKHDASVQDVTLIQHDPPTEYRSGDLPAYRVTLDHPKHPHIYIDAQTGRITSRRNDQWRAFDFFWMLHTMDYAGRDNFNHPLLTIASVIAILTTLAGLSLWAWRFVPRKKRAVRTADAIE
jgi:hypothetical protein